MRICRNKGWFKAVRRLYGLFFSALYRISLSSGYQMVSVHNSSCVAVYAALSNYVLFTDDRQLSHDRRLAEKIDRMKLKEERRKELSDEVGFMTCG